MNEKTTIVKECANSSYYEAISQILGRHDDTCKRFLKDPSPRKKCSYSWDFRTVNERNMRYIVRRLRKNLLQKSNSIFAAVGRP